MDLVFVFQVCFAVMVANSAQMVPMKVVVVGLDHSNLLKRYCKKWPK